MPDFTRIPFPLRGVDRSTPLSRPPDLTCPDALNVRGFTPATSSGRLGGGTREGFTKAVSAQAGSASNRRINAGAFVPRTQIATPVSSGALQPVIDTFSGLQPNAVADFGGDYVIIEKKSNCTGLIGQKVSTHSYYFTTTASAFTPGVVIGGNENHQGTNDGSGIASDALGAKILAVMYKTSNDMKMTFAADFKATADNSATGIIATDEPTYLGACIRASDYFQNFIVAYLAFVTTNTVQLVIDKHESTGGVATVTRLKTSTQTIALTNKTRVTSDPRFSIRLNVIDNVLTATASCSTMRPATDTISIESFTTFSGNSRAGVWMGMGDNAVNYGGRRWINQLEYSRYVPSAVTLVDELLGSAYPGAATVAATDYFMPSPWRCIWQAGNNTVAVTVDGPVDNASQNLGTTQTQAAILNNTNKIVGVAAGGGLVSTMVFHTTSTSTSQVMEIRFDASLTNPATTADTVSPVFRVVAESGGMYSGVRSYWTREISTHTAAMSQSWLKTIAFGRMIKTFGGSVGVDSEAFTTETPGYGTSDTPAPVFPLRTPMRWVMSASTNKISIIVNDLVLYTSTYSTSHNSSSSLVGAEFAGPGAVVANAIGFRIVLPTSVTVTSVSAGTDIVAFTPAAVQVADFASLNAWTTCSGTGPSTANIEYALLNNKMYVVDGFSQFVVDPITKTIQPWTAKLGTVPAACQLACTYRGRVVIARQNSNTSIWYASRINDPLDYDFGATDLTAKAILGTNATVGQPPDPITCLIPFADDYLLFGCLSQIWVLQGDPGAGGSIQNLSFQTGIIGPRSWCKDDAGNLYFVGTGGLYVMARTTREFKNVGGKRLTTLLDSINATDNLIQMGYDNLRQTVHVFVTPNQTVETSAQTAGLHIVFDPTLDAFWLDKYPITFGPFSVIHTSGPAPEQRRFWIGGNDGYFRKPTDSAYDDDGTAIDSWFLSAAIELGDGQLESIAQEIQATGAVQTGAGGALTSGTVDWYWRTGDSCAEVAALAFAPTYNGAASVTYTATGTWFSGTDEGFQTPTGMRATGGAHQLGVRLSSSSTRFSLDSISALIIPTGRKRV